MSEAKDKQEVTIEEESKMSLEDIFKRCTKCGVIEDYDNTRLGFRGLNENPYFSDDSEAEEEEEENNDDSDSDDDDDDDDENENGEGYVFGWM